MEEHGNPERKGKKSEILDFTEDCQLSLQFITELIVYHFINSPPLLCSGPSHHDFSPNFLHQLINPAAATILLKSDHNISAHKEFLQLPCNSEYKVKSLPLPEEPYSSCPHYKFHWSAPVLTQLQPHGVPDSFLTCQEPLHYFLSSKVSSHVIYTWFYFLL